MKILIFSQYFWPESFIINDFVKNLTEQGHDVTVATGKPNYPSGNIFEGYKSWDIHYEIYLEKVEVFRVPLWARGNGGAINLIFNYFSFVLAGLIFFPWLLRNKKFDTILVFAPSPIVQAIPAILLKFLYRVPLTIWVQDLWPESLSATNFIKNKFILSCVGVLVRLIYKYTDTLLVQSQAFIDPVAQYADRKKIIYFPNSYDSTSMRVDQNIKISEELTDILKNNFCFLFAGNLGTAQALNTLTQSAEMITDLKNCKIIFVGSGSQMNWLTDEIKNKNLNNVFLAGRYPMEAMPLIFELSQVLLVSLKDEPIFRLTIPSKIQAYLAANKPILAAINGEGARIILESGSGLVVPAENTELLATTMRKMYYLDKQELLKMGTNARDYFNRNFDMSTQVKLFTSLMVK